MMLRRISVVIMTMSASVLRLVSPVCRPHLLLPKRAAVSINFWLLRALRGVV
jgi:hypothetical protein